MNAYSVGLDLGTAHCALSVGRVGAEENDPVLSAAGDYQKRRYP